jgi:hypothetical protein
MQQARVLELEMSIRHSEPRACFWRRFQEKGATHFLAPPRWHLKMIRKDCTAKRDLARYCKVAAMELIGPHLQVSKWWSAWEKVFNAQLTIRQDERTLYTLVHGTLASLYDMAV